MTCRGKLSVDEIKARKRKKEKERYARIMSDPSLKEIEKRKSKEKYESKKRRGIVKLVSDMTPHERRVKRKLWRERSRKYNKKMTKCRSANAVLKEENL